MLSPLKRDILSTNGRLPPQVILLGFVSLLNDAASEMIYPLLPVFLTATLGATPVIVGMIEGAADAVASVLKLFAGSWSDRLRRRKPLVVTGYALAAASRALIAAAAGWTAVLAARLIDRSGKGIRSAPRDALISDVTPMQNRGRAFGFHRALDHTGAIVGPIAALVMLQLLHLPMRTVFYIAVIPGAIAVVLLMFVLKEAVGARVSSPARFEGRAGEDTRAPLTGVLIPIALFSLANSSDAFLILQAHAAGVPAAMLPALWAAHHVVKSLFSTWAGALSDRVGRRWLLASGWLTYAVIYALFPFATTLPAFIALFVAYAIPFTLSEGAERALIADLVPAHARGRGFGVYYLVNGFGVLAGSMLFGWLYQQFSPMAAFATGAALSLAAAIAISDNRLMLKAATLAAVLAVAYPLAAQERLSESIEVRVVNVDAVVTDRAGRPVTGLTPADFEILEDGRPQTITNFFEVRGGESVTPRGATAEVTAAPARRFIFFIDNESLHPHNRTLFADGLRKFIATQLRPFDLAAVVTWNGTLSVAAPLTADRRLLLAAIDAAAADPGAGAVRSDLARVQKQCTTSLDRATTRAVGVRAMYEECMLVAREQTMASAFRSRQLLNAIEVTMTMIAGTSGRKIFVLAGARLPRSPGSEIFQWANHLFQPHMRGFDAAIRRPDQDDEQLDFLQRVARSANAHGVTLYGIAATTSADANPGDHEYAIPDGGAGFMSQANTFDAYETLSDMTGGSTIRRPSDFAEALASIAAEAGAYYSLGYRPKELAGGERQIVVRVKNRDSIVRSRRTHAMKTADELMSDQVVANIFAPETASPWRPEVTTAAAEREGKAHKVRFEVEIPPEVTLLPDGDALAGRYTIYVAVGTPQGALSTVFRQPRNVRIAAAEENAFRREPLLFGGTLTVRPGENIISVGVVDQLSGDKGFARTTVVAK